jgi:hypothetical protein
MRHVVRPSEALAELMLEDAIRRGASVDETRRLGDLSAISER